MKEPPSTGFDRPSTGLRQAQADGGLDLTGFGNLLGLSNLLGLLIPLLYKSSLFILPVFNSFHL